MGSFQSWDVSWAMVELAVPLLLFLRFGGCRSGWAPTLVLLLELRPEQFTLVYHFSRDIL